MTNTFDCTEEELGLLTASERVFLGALDDPYGLDVIPTRETICRHARFLVEVKKLLPDVSAKMIAEDNNGNVYVHLATLFSFLNGKTGKFTFRACTSAEGTGDLLGEFESLSDATEFAVKYLKSKEHLRPPTKMPQQTLNDEVPDVPLMKYVAPAYPQTAKVFNVLLKEVEENFDGVFCVGDKDDEKELTEEVNKLNALFEKHHLAKLASFTSDDNVYTLHLVPIPENTEMEPKVLGELKAPHRTLLHPQVLFDLSFEFLVSQWVDDDEMFHKKIMHFNTLLDSYGLKFAMLPLYKHDLKWIHYE